MMTFIIGYLSIFWMFCVIVESKTPCGKVKDGQCKESIRQYVGTLELLMGYTVKSCREKCKATSGCAFFMLGSGPHAVMEGHCLPLKAGSDKQCSSVPGTEKTYGIYALEECKAERSWYDCDMKDSNRCRDDASCSATGVLCQPNEGMCKVCGEDYHDCSPKELKKIYCEALAPAPACPVDIGVVMDASYSIGGKDGKGADGVAWASEKAFVRALARLFDINPNGPHMGLIYFSETAKLQIPLTEFDNSQAFEDAVEKVPYQGWNTRLDLALKLASSEMFSSNNGARTSAKKVLIVISDGSQSYRHLKKALVNPLPYAKKLQASGVKVIVVGVADTNGNIEDEVLVGLTGDEKLVKKSDSFVGILETEFLKAIKQESCNA